MPLLPPLALNAWLRYDVISRALADVPLGSTMLEIGAGQGGIGARLARRFQYTGLEPDPISAHVARTRIEANGGRFLQGLPSDLAGEQFAVVCAFEVLEHLENDGEALREWKLNVEPGGWLVLSVPAYQTRFGPADRMAGHYRRYEPDALHAVLMQAGFTSPETWVTGFPLGFGLEHARNLIGRFRSKDGTMAERTMASGRLYQPPAALGFATQVATLPFRWMQRPFTRTGLGTGLVAKARRPSQ